MSTARKIIFGLSLTISSASALAQDCTSVIGLSKTKNVVVQASSQLEQYARDFCSKYGSSTASESGMSASASYKVLSGSFGKSNASRSEIISEYCDATNSTSAKDSSYRHYIENIAPGAYDSYTACEKLRNTNLDISVSPASILPRFLTITAAYATNNAMAGQQIVTYTASPGVSCSWANSNNSKTTLTGNASDALSCNRNFDNQQSTITVFPLTNPQARLILPWDSYSGGVPQKTLQTLYQTIESMHRSAVVSFSSSSCPAGWSEYAPAYGRFIRGIDRSATPADPDGQRAPGSLQSDAFKKHDHARPNDVFNAGQIGTGSVPHGTNYAYGFGDDRRTSAVGDAESRPKNVALLFCHRD